MKEFLKNLENKIQESYESGVTLESAERLAAEFLHAQIQLSAALKSADLDSRMRKSGVKAIRAAIYKNAVSGLDKKPTEAAIQSTIDSDKLLMEEQKSFDEAEVGRDDLKRYYDIFANAHIFFRGVSKGRFE